MFANCSRSLVSKLFAWFLVKQFANRSRTSRTLRELLASDMLRIERTFRQLSTKYSLKFEMFFKISPRIREFCKNP